MAANRNFRLRILAAIFVVIAVILTAKLFFVQIVRGEDYKASADRQYERPAGQTFDRGSIYFTSRENKLISGAILRSGFSLVINPIRLKEPESTYDRLNAIIPLDRKNFLDRAAKRDDPHEEIASRLTVDQAKTITALNLTGVELEEQKWRFYPGGATAAHVLGFLGYQGNDYSGRYGLEKYYDNVLRRAEPLTFSSFLSGIFGGLTDISSAADQTGDLVTTIEPTAQRFLERELESISLTTNGRTRRPPLAKAESAVTIAIGVMAMPWPKEAVAYSTARRLLRFWANPADSPGKSIPVFSPSKPKS